MFFVTQKSRLDVDTTRDESDESEDEGEKRGGRFKSERQDIITVTTKKSIASEIPTTLGKFQIIIYII